MEDNKRRENSNEATEDGMRNDGSATQQERCSDDQYQLIGSSVSSRKLRRSRSRSRSMPRRRKQWRSANAFLNFMQDFRQRNNKLKNKDLFRVGGQTWRQMSSAEKTPYVDAAKLAQERLQNDTSGQQTKPANGDSPKKSENQKDRKRREREERRRSRSKTDISETESDSTSETGASVTSENDASDLSS